MFFFFFSENRVVKAHLYLRYWNRRVTFCRKPRRAIGVFLKLKRKTGGISEILKLKLERETQTGGSARLGLRALQEVRSGRDRLLPIPIERVSELAVPHLNLRAR